MKKLIVIACLFFISIAGALPAIAQDCPPTLGDPDWLESPYNLEFGSMLTPFGYVNSCFYRSTANGYEIKVNWNTMANNKPLLTDDEIKQMMYKAVIVNLLGHDCHFGGTKEFIFYEETQCMVKKRCYLKLYYDTYIECQDDCWAGPDMTVYEKDGAKYYKVESEEPCGVQCCQFIYTVKCVTNPENGEVYPHIVNIETMAYPGSECTGGDTDCLNGSPIPCSSTCN